MNSFQDTAGKTAQKAGAESKKTLNAGFEGLTGFADDVTADLKKGAGEAERMVREYSKSAMDLAKRHPIYATLAAVGAGLVVGAILSRRKDVE
jgi:hypothetical protein